MKYYVLWEWRSCVTGDTETSSSVVEAGTLPQAVDQFLVRSKLDPHTIVKVVSEQWEIEQLIGGLKKP